jgi:AbiU2
MFVSIEGDYSKLPESIRGIFKLLEEHVLGLHEGYGVYRHLFMKSEHKTDTLAAYTGATLAWFQNFLQDAMCLQIAKLTDPDNRVQENLTIHKLAELGVPLSRDPISFGARVKGSQKGIEQAVKNIRTHRHKRLGHFDLDVSLKESLVPLPVFQEIHHAIELLGQFLTMFHQEFGGPETRYEFVREEDITDQIEITVRKAMAYEALERAGRAQHNEWTALTKGFHQ